MALVNVTTCGPFSANKHIGCASKNGDPSISGSACKTMNQHNDCDAVARFLRLSPHDRAIQITEEQLAHLVDELRGQSDEFFEDVFWELLPALLPFGAMPSAVAAIQVLAKRCPPRELHLACCQILESPSQDIEPQQKLVLVSHCLVHCIERAPPDPRKRSFMVKHAVSALVDSFLPQLRASTPSISTSSSTTSSTRGTAAAAMGVRIMEASNEDQAVLICLDHIRELLGFAERASAAAVQEEDAKCIARLVLSCMAELGQWPPSQKEASQLLTTATQLMSLIKVPSLQCLEHVDQQHRQQQEHSQPDDEDDSEEGDKEAQGTASHDTWRLSEMGVGVYLHVSLKSLAISSVLSPKWLLEASLPSLCSMVAPPPPASGEEGVVDFANSSHMVDRGWDAIHLLLSSVSRGTLLSSTSSTMPQQQQQLIHIGCIKCMLASMVRCSSSARRTSMLHTFKCCLSAFSAPMRFAAIKAVLSDNPLPTLACLMVRLLKEDVIRSWPGVATNQEDTAFFASRKLLELMPLFMLSSNLVEKNELIMDALNLYLFLLMKDTPRGNLTGLWSNAQLLEVEQRFLGPLEGEIRRMKEEYSQADGDENVAQQRIESLKRIGMPGMTMQEFKRVNSQAILNLMLMDDLIDRVHEYIRRQSLVADDE